MFDAEGKAREAKDIVDGQFIAHGEKGDAPGFRKVTFGPAAKPLFDHVNFHLYGGGGFLFLTDKKRWR
jgi:hypothetical protein